MNFSGLEAYLFIFLRGIGYTLLLSIASIGIGIVLTILIFAPLNSHFAPIRTIANLLSEAIRLCPPLVVLIWIYYAMPAVGLVALPAGPAAALALGLYFAVFGADILRGAIATIPSGLWDTEIVFAHSRWHFYRTFVVPDLFRRTFAAMNAQIVSTVKNTSLASVIAVPELTYTASLVATEVVRPFEVYSILAIGYILTIAPTVLAIRRAEKSKWVALEPGHVAQG